jgi:hypothetical protein
MSIVDELPPGSMMILVVFISICLTHSLLKTSVLLHGLFQCFVGGMFIVVLSVYKALRMRSCRKENAEYLKRVKRYAQDK